MTMRSAALLLVLLVAACGSPGAEGPARSDGGGADAAAAPSDSAVEPSDAAAPDAAVKPSDAGAPDAGSAPDAATRDGGPPDLGVAPVFAYVGSGDNQIHQYRVDTSSGALTPLARFPGATNPSFLAIDAPGRRLYAVNEITAGSVTAFSMSAGGALTLLNSTSSKGAGPAHVSLDGTRKWVLVANYGGGTAAVLPATWSGVGASVDTESPGQNAHLIATEPSNRFAYVPCLGSNLVAQFSFDAATGMLTPTTPSLATSGGPRHLAFYPGGKFAYLLHETSSELSALSIDATSGKLSLLQTLSTLPSGFSGTNSGAEVQVHPGGKFVYASNRGDDSIAVFAIDAVTGKLTPVSHHSTGGTRPRHFSLDPSGALLYAANQGTGTVFAFRVDQATGKLTSLGQVAAVSSPAFVGLVELR